MDFGTVANSIDLCQYKYKKTNESNYGSPINITPTISGENISFNSTIVGDEGANGFNLSYSYNIQIIIQDKIETTTYDILLGVGSPGMAIHRSGISFGAPYDTTEGGHLQLDGKQVVALVGKTTNSYGTAYKYSDGTMISEMKYQVSSQVSTAWGNIYISSLKSLPSYPAQFIEIPNVQLNAIGNSNDGTLLFATGNISISTPPSIYLARGEPLSTATTFIIHILAFGKWK